MADRVWTAGTTQRALAVAGQWAAADATAVELIVKNYLDAGWSIVEITTLEGGGNSVLVIVAAAIYAEGAQTDPNG